MNNNILEQIAEIEEELKGLKEYILEEIEHYGEDGENEEFYKTDSMIHELKRQIAEQEDKDIKKENIRWINLLEFNKVEGND